jgi:hypothetical protein
LNRRFDLPQVKGVDMGQAALDLPDPLETPAVNPASTDDLLAQMAGQEIERLLSAADEGDAAAMAEPAASPPVAPKLEQSKSVVAEPKPATAEPAAAATAHDLDAIFSQLEGPAAGAQPPKKTETGSHTADSSPSVADALAEEMAEDAALHAKSSNSLSAADSAANAKEPLVLRLLAWLSSPLDSCSDRVRDAIGKVAILTTVNALSVLAYVLLFRRH